MSQIQLSDITYYEYEFEFEFEFEFVLEFVLELQVHSPVK